MPQLLTLDRNTDTLLPGILGVQADVSDDTQVTSAIDRTVVQLGGLDVVVDNAGISAAGDVASNSDEEWLRVLDVHVAGMVRVARHAVPHLRRSPNAAIVNTCSIVAWGAGFEKRVLYSSSKGAVCALTLAMTADHLREGIRRVNRVAPGIADTPWVDRLLDETADPAGEQGSLNARQPMGRMVPQMRSRVPRKSVVHRFRSNSAGRRWWYARARLKHPSQQNSSY